MSQRLLIPLRLKINIFNMTARPCRAHTLYAQPQNGLSPFTLHTWTASISSKRHTPLPAGLCGDLHSALPRLPQPALDFPALGFAHPSSDPGSKVTSLSNTPWSLRPDQVQSEAFMKLWFFFHMMLFHLQSYKNVIIWSTSVSPTSIQSISSLHLFFFFIHWCVPSTLHSAEHIICSQL